MREPLYAEAAGRVSRRSWTSRDPTAGDVSLHVFADELVGRDVEPSSDGRDR